MNSFERKVWAICNYDMNTLQYIPVFWTYNKCTGKYGILAGAVESGCFYSNPNIRWNMAPPNIAVIRSY